MSLWPAQYAIGLLRPTAMGSAKFIAGSPLVQRRRP